MPYPVHSAHPTIKLFAVCLFVVFLMAGTNLEANVAKLKLPAMFSAQIRLETVNSECLEWPTSFISDLRCHMQRGAQVGPQVWFTVQVVHPAGNFVSELPCASAVVAIPVSVIRRAGLVQDVSGYIHNTFLITDQAV